jgi:DNA-directed RNA polymerase specialized sigma24 family protein
MLKFLTVLDRDVEPPDQPRPLVARITINHCIEVLRRRVEEEVEFGPDHEMVGALPFDPSREDSILPGQIDPMDSRVVDLLYRALEELMKQNERHAMAVKWQLDGRAPTELASIHDVGVNTVHKWAQRGRNWIQSRILELLGTPDQEVEQ